MDYGLRRGEVMRCEMRDARCDAMRCGIIDGQIDSERERDEKDGFDSMSLCVSYLFDFLLFTSSFCGIAM